MLLNSSCAELSPCWERWRNTKHVVRLQTAYYVFAWVSSNSCSVFKENPSFHRLTCVRQTSYCFNTNTCCYFNSLHAYIGSEMGYPLFGSRPLYEPVQGMLIVNWATRKNQGNKSKQNTKLSIQNMHFKISLVKWPPFCFDFNELIGIVTCNRPWAAIDKLYLRAAWIAVSIKSIPNESNFHSHGYWSPDWAYLK